MGRVEKQVDRRARELPGEYRRPLERLDRLHHGTGPGETGRLVAKLQSYGRLQGFVVGHWGEGSKDLHTFVQTCAEAKVAATSLGTLVAHSHASFLLLHFSTTTTKKLI